MGGTEGEWWAWVGQGKVVVGKWRQLYSNINKKSKKTKRHQVNSRRINTMLRRRANNLTVGAIDSDFDPLRRKNSFQRRCLSSLK